MRSRRLGEQLIAEGLLSPEQLRQSIVAQQAGGGRLDTVLLEMGYLPEPLLLAALGRFHRARTATAADLAAATHELARLISPRVAKRFELVPFRLEGKRLSVASLDPGDLLIEDEIALLTGCLVSSFAVLEVRLYEALARLYKIPRSPRLQSVSRRLADGTVIPQGPLPAPRLEPPPRPRPTRKAAAPVEAPAEVLPAVVLDPTPHEIVVAPSAPPTAGATPIGEALPSIAEPSIAEPSIAEPSIAEPSIAEQLPEATPSLPAPTAPAPPPAVMVDEAAAAATIPDEQTGEELSTHEVTTVELALPEPAEPAAPPPARSAPTELEISTEELELFPSLRDNGEQPVPAEPEPVTADLAEGESVETVPIEPRPDRGEATTQELDPELRLAAASVELLNAEMREDIADTLLAFCAPYLRRRALFIVRGEQVVGWRGEGNGIKAVTIRQVAIPAGEPSVFLGLLQGAGFWLSSLPSMPQNRVLVSGLGGQTPPECVVLPVVVKSKPVCFLYGDNLDAALGDLPIPHLRRLVNKAGVAFQVYILKSKIRTL